MSKKKSSWSVDSMLKNAEIAGQSQYKKQSEDFSKVKANTSFTRPASTASVASSSASGVDKNDEDTSSVAERIKAAGQAQSEKSDPLRSAAAEYVKNHPVGNGIVQKVSPSGSPIVDASGKTAYAPAKTFNESINTAKRESASRANDINKDRKSTRLNSSH